MMVLRVLLAAALLVWLHPHSARALDLRVERGASCLDEAELQRELALVAPREVLQAPADVVVTGSAHDPRTVRMRVRHPDGAVFERTFSPAPERCPHLSQVVALALALALKAIPPALERAPDTRASSVVQGLIVGLGPLLGVGLGAGLAAGGELSGVLQFPHAALRVSGLAARSSQVELASGYFDSVSVSARLDACARLAFKRELHGELCLGALAGRLYLRGGGLAYALHDQLRQLGFSAELGVTWRWQRGTQLRAGGGISAGLEPLDVVVRNESGSFEDQRRLPPVTGLFVVALRYDFFTQRTARAKASWPSDMKE